MGRRTTKSPTRRPVRSGSGMRTRGSYSTLVLLVHIGRRFADRYLVLGEAGAGGMGTVHRATDVTTNETVALKIVRAATDFERARFEREAAILGQLVHPGIVRYIEHGVAPDGSCFLVMEWVTGTTLADRLRDPGLSLGETIAMARRLGAALDAAHARGVVHRDVKPA